MGLAVVLFDPDADPGEKFSSPAVRDEVGELAPVFIEEGSVTESKYGNSSIPSTAYKPGSITSAKIGAKEVKRANIDDDAVGTDQLEAGCVTIAETGVGVVTSVDANIQPIQMTQMFLTAAEYNQILTPDPNTMYIITT